MTLAYKVLAPNRHPYHGGNGQWPRQGRWLRVTGQLEPCRHGLHLCRRDDLVKWLGPEIWLAEYKGDPVDGGDKIVVAEARLVERFDSWNDRAARSFAADCAARALRAAAKRTGRRSDPRSLAAVRAARKFADGDISRSELAAAGVAAWDAAGVAAWAAARAAARDAAWDAAWAAARDAAGVAARGAARDAERAWQTKRLFEILDGKRYAA